MWCKGIVNGRNAQVKDIIYPLNKTNETLPDAIIVHIPEYTGPQFFNDIERHNYIPLVATNQYSKVVYATRQQYPIRLGYSITTHKTQGNFN